MTIDRISAGFKFVFEDDKGKKQKKDKPVVEEAPVHHSAKKSDYPIIGDAGFSVPWLVTRQEPSYAIKWMRERWHYFNTHRFKGVMKEPHFALAKNIDINKLKTRGDWESATSKLRLVPALFQAPDERYANHVLIHEMCHQYTAQILGDRDDSHAHGQQWQQTMIMVGMSPNRYDFTSNKMFMNKTQQKQALKKVEVQQALKVVNSPKPFSVYCAHTGNSKMIPVMFVGQILADGVRQNVVIVDPKDTKHYSTISKVYVLHNKRIIFDISGDIKWIARAKDVERLLKKTRQLLK